MAKKRISDLPAKVSPHPDDFLVIVDRGDSLPTTKKTTVGNLLSTLSVLAQGPAGATGPQGTAGAQGATGPIGATGLVGAMGPTGTRGATGFNGPQGNSGATGPAGPAGVPGSQGATGATGPAPPVTAGPTADSVYVGGVLVQAARGATGKRCHGGCQPARGRRGWTDGVRRRGAR